MQERTALSRRQLHHEKNKEKSASISANARFKESSTTLRSAALEAQGRAECEKRISNMTNAVETRFKLNCSNKKDIIKLLPIIRREAEVYKFVDY